MYGHPTDIPLGHPTDRGADTPRTGHGHPTDILRTSYGHPTDRGADITDMRGPPPSALRVRYDVRYGVCTMSVRCPFVVLLYMSVHVRTMSVRCPCNVPAMYAPCSRRRATQLRCHLKVRDAVHPLLRHPCLYMSATCPYMSVHVRTCPYDVRTMSVRCPCHVRGGALRSYENI